VTALLAGRTAVVTGAASGIGAAIADAYAAEGAALCLVDRSVEPLADVAARFAATGTRVNSVAADVSNEDDVTRLFATAEVELGPVDVVVNYAGILTECRVQDMSAALWNEMIAVDLCSVFRCCRVALPSMQGPRLPRTCHWGASAPLPKLPLGGAACQ